MHIERQRGRGASETHSASTTEPSVCRDSNHEAGKRGSSHAAFCVIRDCRCVIIRGLVCRMGWTRMRRRPGDEEAEGDSVVVVIVGCTPASLASPTSHLFFVQSWLALSHSPHLHRRRSSHDADRSASKRATAALATHCGTGRDVPRVCTQYAIPVGCAGTYHRQLPYHKYHARARHAARRITLALENRNSSDFRGCTASGRPPGAHHCAPAPTESSPLCVSLEPPVAAWCTHCCCLVCLLNAGKPQHKNAKKFVAPGRWQGSHWSIPSQKGPGV